MLAQFAAWFDAALWFWIAAALLWWHVCAATLGVPHALLDRAVDHAEDAALFERLARRNVALAAEAWRRNGMFWTGVAAFAIAFTAAYAVIQRNPPAAAGFCLLTPLALHMLFLARAATAMEAAPPEREALRKRFKALRAQAYGAAMASIALALILRGASRLAALS
jgi:hypothetical protein